MDSTPKETLIGSPGSLSTSRPAPTTGEEDSDFLANGGWFLAHDLNDDTIVVRLPARFELGS